MSFCTSWNFSPQSFVYLIISPESFVWLITMYKLKENYTVGTKGLCCTDFWNYLFSFHLIIDFCSYGFYRGIFAPIAPNESCSICSGVLVDFKFGIDFQEMNKYAVSLIFIMVTKALFQGNCIKSVISLISLKSVDFGNISDKYSKW